MSALSDLIDIVSNTDCQWLDTRYDADATPTDIAEQVYAEVRREAFTEAADVVDHAFHNEPFLNYPPDFATYLRARATQDAATDTQPPAAEPTQSAPGFFQPGRTYCINDGVDRADFLGWLFRAEHIGHHDGKRVAFGYLTNRHPDASWNPHFEGEESWAAGWDDVTADPAGRFPSFDASGGETR